MKKSIDKFLMNDKVLYAMPWIFAAATIAWQITAYITNTEAFSVFNLGLDIINIFLVFGITISYSIHEKNIMKTLFGAIMAENIIAWFYWVTLYIAKETFSADLIFTIIILCFYILFFINHIALGYGHRSNPARIELNRIVALFSTTVNILWYIILPGSILLDVFGIIYVTTFLIELLCIETKVDVYKIIRENKNR